MKMETPVVVSVSERPTLPYKKYSMKVFKVDPLGTFSSIPHEVMPTKDTGMYI